MNTRLQRFANPSYLYEADDLDAAIELAARIPAARMAARSRCARSWSART
jgi:hypothetical protein